MLASGGLASWPPNGDTIFDSGEGYRHRGDCEHIVSTRSTRFRGIEIRYLDGEA